MAIGQTAASQIPAGRVPGQAMPATVTPGAILATVALEAGLDPDKVSLDSTLEGLDIGSLDLVSILFALEEEFDLELVPETIDRSWTVAQFADHVASLPPR